MKNYFLTVAILFLVSFYGNAEQMQITGTVTNSTDGAVLPGVSIVIKGTTTGTITDMNGQYAIMVNNLNAILEFSFVGMITEEVVVGKQKIIDVSLVEDICSLDEIVVLGYGGGLQGRLCGVTTSRTNRVRKANRRQNTVYSQPTFNPTLVQNESYESTKENGFKQVSSSPLSTFSIDVDNAAYSNVRRFLNMGQLPPKDAVRVEEMINYFNYQYTQPVGEHPIHMVTEVSSCPWQKEHKLMHVGMQANDIDKEELPAANLVFLIDVSGSMGDANKLPLLKQSMGMLVDNLREKDRVAIVVYAGAAGLVLPSTSGKQKEKIIQALSQLQAGGSTAGGAGIQLAYKVAQQNFIKNGNNRVILATDGDFNVGASSDKDMEQLITEKRETGIYLTCLGYGMGNYKDSKMETLADKGNGNYGYIDNIQEAEKQLISGFGGTLFTVAKDVKIQIEFNPQYVAAYRLVGYENRMLNDEDFKDDTKDAGEIGAGQTVTALYEIIPVGVTSEFSKNIDPLKYQNPEANRDFDNEIATVKVRYKPDAKSESIPFDVAVHDSNTPVSETSENFRFATSVAMFGMLLTESDYVKDTDYDDVLVLAKNSKSLDEDGYKAEFVRLVKSASSLR